MRRRILRRASLAGAVVATALALVPAGHAVATPTGDGSVRTSTESIDPNVYQSLVTRSGGEVISEVAFGSGHTSGINVGLGDGSVRFIRDSIDPIAL